MYPSLDQKESAAIVAEAIIESDIKYVGVDMDIAGVYLATVWEKDRLKREGLFRLLPRRKSTRGRKVTVNSKELSGPIPREGNRIRENDFGRKLDEDEFMGEESVSSKWERYRGQYTEGEKKIIIAKCIQAGIEVAFSNHIYWYHAELY